MFISNRNEKIKTHLHQALNLVEEITLENCFCPRAKEIVIIKIEEALMWLDYEGRCAPLERDQVLPVSKPALNDIIKEKSYAV